jgi:hypothetical protein
MLVKSPRPSFIDDNFIIPIVSGSLLKIASYYMFTEPQRIALEAHGL